MHPYIINKSTLTRCQIILSTSLSIDDVAFIIAVLGPGALVAKYDVKSAFRLILIAPSNFDQLGFKFQEKKKNTTLTKVSPCWALISCAI